MRNITLIVLALFVTMCHSSQQVLPVANQQAPLIVYKTTKDYTKNIPITLNDTKDQITSYPAITDITKNCEFKVPTPLDKGFLLDNFGLSANSVYTSYTFEEYAKLEKEPTIQELMNRIIDDQPIIEMYNCGKRSEFETTKEVNYFIKHKLKKASKLK